MGFNEVKRKIIACLKSGQVLHEARNNIDIKNLLATGDITAEQVALIISRAGGNHYSSSPHHYDNSVEVHIIKTRYLNFSWYVKWYFLDDDSVFISVHCHREKSIDSSCGAMNSSGK